MNVLIFGGTGSLGTALTRSLIDDGHNVICVSHSEYRQFKMSQNFASAIAFKRLSIVNCDIRKPVKLNVNVDAVVNAAAMKHVSMCEDNPCEAFDTNVVGNQHIIDWCISNNIQGKCIYIGTDKAIKPINFYGYSKLIAERQWLDANNRGCVFTPQFEVIRFGNLFGSSGSVVQIFLSNRTGVFDISHMESERYFISIDDAADAVLSAINNVPYDIKCKKIKIVNLIKTINPNAKLNIVGLRPGEKLIEDFDSQQSNGYWSPIEVKCMLNDVRMYNYC